VDRFDEAWDRLMFEHYGPREDSVASLASLHNWVNEHRDEMVETRNGKVPRYLHMTQALDGLIDRARRSNDFTWLRKYAAAVEFAASGKSHKLDLTAHSLLAWRQLRESLGRPPHRKEVRAWVEQQTEVKFTPRQWRRVFMDLAELFKQSE
jgi:hypothetical protein